MKKSSLFVKAYNLTSCPEAWINCKDTLLADRRSKEKLTEIFSEYPYGLDISLFLGFLYDFIGNRRFEKPLECIIKGHVNMFCKRGSRISSLLTEVVIYLLAASFRIGIDLHIQESFFRRTQNRKETVRGDTFQRLGIIEI